jgi:hypothetical protein
MWMLTVAAAVAGKWDSADPDVKASATIAAPAEKIFEIISDLEKLKLVTPPDCVGKWEMGIRTQGAGASAIVRYDIAAMHRRLVMTVARAEPNRLVDLDHAGPRGFVTRYTIEPVGGSESNGSSIVNVLTPLNPPPWPFQSYFFTVVKPEWEGCQARTLGEIQKLLR